MTTLDNKYEAQVNAIDYTGQRVIIRDSEEGVIGSVLRGGLPVYQRVKDIIRPEMFGNNSNGEIWNAIEKLFERGLGIDTITVGDELERELKLDSVSNGQRVGRALLSDLRAMGDPRNVESYAENVQDYHVKKLLEDYGKKMIVWSANGRRSGDIMRDVNKLLGEIVLYSGKAQDHIYDISKSVSQAYDETYEASQGKVKRYPTGLVDLDKMLNKGFKGGNFIIAAARPGQGKTGLLVTVTLNAMKANKKTLFFSLEMTAGELTHRLLAQQSGIPVDRLISGDLKQDEWPVYTQAVEYLSSLKEYLTIIDLPALKIGNIRQLARREFIKNKYDGIILDYVQLGEPDRQTEKRQLDLGQVSRGLKQLAKELDVPVFTAAQLSRAVEQRTDKRPMLSDLREAGDLEQDADIVMFIYRPDQYEKETDKQGTAEIIIAKHRNGQVGSVETVFRPSLTKFENATSKIFSPNK